MKKLLIAAFALCLTGNAMALDNEPKKGLTYQALFGFSATTLRGMETLMLTPNGDPYFQSYGGRVGATLGAKAEYMIPNAHGTYINAGINWMMKGAKQSFTLTDPQTKATTPVTYSATRHVNCHYMEVPVHVGFRYNINKTLGVYGDLGPYFAVGVGGRKRLIADEDGYLDFNESPKTFKKSAVGQQFGSSTPEETGQFPDKGFQRFDCGFGFRVGAEVQNHYSLSLGCDWGFTDVYTDEFRNTWQNNHKGWATANGKAPLTLNKPKNFNFTMTFGYRF